MKCPKCQSDNPPETNFCGKCGTPLIPLEQIQSMPTQTLLASLRDLMIGSTFAGRYQVIEELGKGGMGKVYKVLDQKIEEKVALKLLNFEVTPGDKNLERFRNELKLARKISHRYVCRMYDLGEAEGIPYITMEYVAGEDLKSLVRRIGQFTVGRTLFLAKQVCEGLAEAHRLGVVHRDLKPQNIMIDRDGNVRIMDFGIARSMRTQGITDTESLEGKGVDQRTDIYSLGIILFEMLTGKVPFEGDTPLNVALKQKTEIPQDPQGINPHITDDLSHIILKCLNKDRTKRYDSAAELYSEMDNVEKSLPTTGRIVSEKRPLTSREITVKFRMAKILIPGLIALTVVILGVLGWWFLRTRKPESFAGRKPSLAVMHFENNTGDSALDHWRKAMSDLLIADLSQSKYISVISAEELYNILEDKNLLDVKSYSSKALKDVASRAGVKYVLVGKMTKAGETIRIDIQLQDPNSGEVIGSERVEGQGEESFFAMVDDLTPKIKSQFKLTTEEIAADIDRDAGAITTSSPEAYKYYREGMKFFLKGDYTNSITMMEMAVGIDSGFASAYRTMAVAYTNLGYGGEGRERLKKAFELTDRVSDRERYAIQGIYYGQSEATYEKAIEAYTELLKLYPEDDIANTNLGGLYLDLEEWDKALEYLEVTTRRQTEAIQPYLALASAHMAKGQYGKAVDALESYLTNVAENPSIYKALADAYLAQGKFESARVEADNMFALDPTHFWNFSLRGDLSFYQGNLAGAENEYQKLLETKKPAAHNEGLRKLSALYVLQERYEDALEQLELGIDLGDMLVETEWKAWFHLYSAYVRLRSEQFDDALESCESSLKAAEEAGDSSLQRRALHMRGLIHLERKKPAEAQRTAAELKDLIESGLAKNAMRYYYHLVGMIELNGKNFLKARDAFAKAVDLLPREYDTNDAQALFIYPLARTYIELGDAGAARKQFKNIVSLTTGRFYSGDIFTTAQKQLAALRNQ
jgi:serine/threonine protein kinase/Tfp pilus assembly protein PilF